MQFFEAAAHMRVPRDDDYDEEEPEQHEEEPSPSWETSTDHNNSTTEDPIASSHDRTFDPNVTPSDSSFMPGHAAVSSTPAKQRPTTTHDETPSWNTSVESSLNRLNEELDGLGLEEGTSNSHSEDTQSTADETVKVPPTPSPRKGKGRQPKQPLLRNVLKQNTFNSSDPSPGMSNDIGIPGLSSPLRRDAAKILARMNPYLPPNTQPSKWDNMVDLSTTRLATPRRDPGTSTYEDDDSFGSDPGLGLSPPTTIDWAVPTKRTPALSKTPRKEAAARIGRDLVSNLEGRSTQSSLFDLSHNRSNALRVQGSEFTESFDSDDPGMGLSPPVTVDWGRIPSHKQREAFKRADEENSTTLSSMSSAPSLTRYLPGNEPVSSSNSELDLDSLMRRVGLDFDVKSDQSHAGSSRLPLDHVTPQHQYTSRDSDEDVVGIPADDYDPDLSDSFEDERPNDTINPSNAFLLASQQRPAYDDDSFGSGDSFSGDEGGGGEGGAVHPFAALGQEYDGGEFDDDSFDDTVHQPVQEDTDTIFGARHAGLPKPRPSQLQLLGEDLVEETQGYGYTAASQDSPTPAARGG